jgi:hypothetical protein
MTTTSRARSALGVDSRREQMIRGADRDRLKSASIKYPTVRFKNLKVALKEIEQFVRDPRHLQTGKPVKQFGNLRPRELLTNWLVCVAFNDACESPDRLTFTTDPTGGDGILLDTQTNETFATEHVIVPAATKGKTVHVEALILAVIDAKNRKGGPACASGKTLIVFLNAGFGVWSPTRVAKKLSNPLHFAVVWVVGLHSVEAGKYIYSVTQLTLDDRNACPIKGQKRTHASRQESLFNYLVGTTEQRERPWGH